MAGLLDPYDSEDKGLLAAIGRAARTARGYISPWNVLTVEDVASNLPGGGIVGGVPMFEEGSKKTKRAREEFAKGNYSDAARFYGSGVLDTATAGLSAAGDVAPLAKLAMTMVPAAKKAAGIRAFHGSPHDFDRFSMDKIGTGEGAQAYGHGLYFAENEGVARSYRDALQHKAPVSVDGVDGGPRYILQNAIQEARKFPADQRAAKLQEWLDETEAMASGKFAPAGMAENVAEIKRLLASGEVRPDLADAGRMYEVRINADPDQFLDWDKPLSEQSEAVKAALNPLGFKTEPQRVWTVNETKGGKFTVRNHWGEVQGTYASREVADAKAKQGTSAADANGGMYVYSQMGGNAAYPGLDKGEASRKLAEAGIPGIKYLDAGSRSAGDGTRNYVVFDDKLIEIIRKYGWAPGMAIPAAMALEIERAQREAEGPQS